MLKCIYGEANAAHEKITSERRPTFLQTTESVKTLHCERVRNWIQHWEKIYCLSDFPAVRRVLYNGSGNIFLYCSMRLY